MPRPTMLFVRYFPGLLGGGLKVFDYVGHVAASQRFEPVLHLRPGSVDPSRYLPSNIRLVDRPAPADAYFVAGADWRFLDEAGIDTRDRPVINLIQGFRHLREGDPNYEFLSRPALRVCVSEALALALRASSRAGGPIVAVSNGLDVRALAPLRGVAGDRVFIAGLKQIALARQVAERLVHAGIDVDCSVERVSRDEFLARIAASAVTVALPFDFEGFYLPALEAMALGSVVVIPHAPGPATYCIDGENAIVTTYDPDELAAAAMRALHDREHRAVLRAAGLRVAGEHSLERERAAFHALLDRYLPEFVA